MNGFDTQSCERQGCVPVPLLLNKIQGRPIFSVFPPLSDHFICKLLEIEKRKMRPIQYGKLLNREIRKCTRFSIKVDSGTG